MMSHTQRGQSGDQGRPPSHPKNGEVRGQHVRLEAMAATDREVIHMSGYSLSNDPDVLREHADITLRPATMVHQRPLQTEHSSLSPSGKHG